MTYKRKAILFKFIAVVLLLAPIGVWMIINRNSYFTNTNGVKVSLGCVIALIIALNLALGKMKKLNPIIWLLIMEVLLILLKSILTDIVWINMCAIIGESLYLIFNYFFEKNKKLADAVSDEEVRERSRQEVKQTFTQEQNQITGRR